MSEATPANRAALAKHFDKFLSGNLNKCITCHLPSDNKDPQSLEEFPHNPFGARLRAVGQDLSAAEKKNDVPERLALIATEDADADGVDNLTELLLGHLPGAAKDTPGENELAEAKKRRADFEKFLSGYRWQPFVTVKRPEIPKLRNSKWLRNPIDAFVATEHEARKLKPRPEAAKPILLRRVYLDLIGLSPTPQELRDFEKDKSTNAYEKVVGRLLADPRYGERWGRHWMDIWRYSDWAGYNAEVRDSKPHIWRWRDWIVDSLNEDKGYDKMLEEMLAADELYPESTNALRATGFLVRNYKMLSREQWLTDTIHHTAKAFLGVTMNCAKCHDHKFDPISQAEYYRFRAIFEPHYVRTDRVSGEHDTVKDGLVRVYDVDSNPPTYLFYRGDERSPNTNHVIPPGVPAALGHSLRIEPIKLPRYAAYPDKRDFAERQAIEASEKAIPVARDALEKIKSDKNVDAKKIAEAELKLALAEAERESLLLTVRAEHLVDEGKKESEEWRKVATEALIAQRKVAVLKTTQTLNEARGKEAEAQTKLAQKTKDAEEMEKAGKDANDVAVAKLSVEKASDDLKKAKTKTGEAEKTLADAEKAKAEPAETAYKPSSPEVYPEISTGRRAALARWLTDTQNPLTARVAMNHIWLRHFGQAIVPTTSDFGLNGRPPTHPQLLDWLAAEFLTQKWSIKAMHQLIVTSSTYRMASTFDKGNAKVDVENVYLWRTPSKRMEAEAVRDNLLFLGGNLDGKMGGPEIPAAQGLTSKRRSLYLRIAAEKEVEFLKIFDGPDPVECYARRPTVMPHQALALANSELALAESRLLAGELAKTAGENGTKFVNEAFMRVLARKPTRQELRESVNFLDDQTKWLLKKQTAASPKAEPTQDKSKSNGAEAKAPAPPAQRAKEDLILVLFNHNDFITVR
ncbi:MAG: DUF1553 domain-containing protein [Verrucomicrobiota bacterium]